MPRARSSAVRSVGPMRPPTPSQAGASLEAAFDRRLPLWMTRNSCIAVLPSGPAERLSTRMSISSRRTMIQASAASLQTLSTHCASRWAAALHPQTWMQYVHSVFCLSLAAPRHALQFSSKRRLSGRANYSHGAESQHTRSQVVLVQHEQEREHIFVDVDAERTVAKEVPTVCVGARFVFASAARQ